MSTIETDRLRLRHWREEDRAPFAAINADPAVMRHFPSVLTRAQSDALVDRIVREWATAGRSFHAVEEKATGRFIGFVGVGGFAPAIPLRGLQVGWRLARDIWGRGYAPEAARATMDDAFADPGLATILSYTVAANAPSLRVMAKLGLARAPELDFEHPELPEGHHLRPHVVHRIGRDVWLAAPAARA
ncbi:MAG: GNAT family N-acetyltransferase [Bauldia sp.]|nr:GNAT family N-acetyltransferase [Bauldia sp.]